MANLHSSLISPQGNAVINGDFNIWQRGTSFVSPAAGVFTADRFEYSKTGAMVHTVSRSTDVPTVAESGHNSTYSLLVDCTTIDASLAATDFTSIIHRIEGYNIQALYKKTLTVSFWVKATKTGIYSISFRNNTVTYESLVLEYTVNVTDTWEKKVLTFDFSGTGGENFAFDNTNGLVLFWALASGSTYQTTAGSWQSGNFIASTNQVNACDNTANNFRLAQVQLEVGDRATPFKFRQFTDELTLCQRYYEKSYGVDIAPGTATQQPGAVFEWSTRNIAGSSVGFHFRVEKRSAPTVVLYNPEAGTSGSIQDQVANRTGTANTPNTKGVAYTTITGSATSSWCRFHWTADAEL